MVSINGAELTGMTEYSVTYQKITKGDRDSTGLMHLDLVARKKKLQLKWCVISQAEASEMLSKFDSLLSFSCAYFDPKTGCNNTITAYNSDPTIGMLVIEDGKAVYKEFAVDIIEM